MIRSHRTRTIMSAALALAFAPGAAHTVLGQAEPAAPEQQQTEQQQSSEQQRQIEQQRSSESEQQQPMAGQQQKKPAAQVGEDLTRAEDLEDLTVRNAQGQEIGQIEEIAIDVTNGRIGYAVVSFEALGDQFADQLYAIPWSAIELSADGQSATLPITQQQLQQAKGFTEDAWPDMADPTWAAATYQQFGEQPYWQQQPQQQAPMQGQSPQMGQSQAQQHQQQAQQGEQAQKQMTQQIQQSFQQAGISEEAAQRHAEQLARQLHQQSQQGELSQTQLTQSLQQAFTQAGVEQQQAAQQAQRLAPQLHQQLQQAKAGGAAGQQAVDQAPQWVGRLSELSELDVVSPEGEQMGEIEDFVIDTREGRVAYAVLSYGGFAGLGENLVAVPWRALNVLPEEESLVLSTDQATLDRLSFEDNQWPDMSDQQWASRVHSAFGEEPYWQVFGYAPAAAGQAQQLEQTLTQAFTQAGVEQQPAQQQARQLAQQLQQQSQQGQLSQQQIEQQISQSLQQAGVEAEQAQQTSRQLAPQLQQQLQSSQGGGGQPAPMR